MAIFNTIPEIFFDICEKQRNNNAIGWVSGKNLHFLTFNQYQNKVYALFEALKCLGIQKGSKVNILSQTRKEWHLADISILCAGAVVVPIYPSYFGKEISFVINHSEAELLFVEDDKQLNKIIEIADSILHVHTIVSFDKIPLELEEKIKRNFKFFNFEEFSQLGKSVHSDHHQFKKSLPPLKGEDIATIVYTSGTTGVPKGAVITHTAFTQMQLNLRAEYKNHFTNQDRTLTFLPLSHIVGRMDSYFHFIFAMEVVYAENMEQILPNLMLVKPTIMVAVPRIFEKVYGKIQEQIKMESVIKQAIFKMALNLSSTYYNKIENNQTPSIFNHCLKKLAYNLVFKKIYNRFGGRIRYFVTGGAPLSSEIIKFLRNAHLCILEGYGLTETFAPCTANPISKQIPGSVGKPIGDSQIKFADDGEILIKSKTLMREYYKNPEATKESLTDDGWLLSGDIGHCDQEGFLYITDRKKDIIITAAGKNVAPQKIENMLKTKKYVSNAMIVGDKRKYLTAVIAIEKNSFKGQLEEFGLAEDASLVEIAKSPKINQCIQEKIDQVNSELASFEKIKTFFISPLEFNVESGHLTPSMKLKKKHILNEFQQEIELMYQLA